MASQHVVVRVGNGDSTVEEQAVAQILISSFRVKTLELASTMEHSRHVKGGWGNVLKASEALMDRAAQQGSEVITLATLHLCIGTEGMPGPGWDRKLKPVHRWMKQIIETGHCDYIDHIVAKDP